MPRNEGLQIEEQAQPRERGAGFDAAAELAGLSYVRLTQRLPPPRDRRRLWWLLALVLLGHALLGWVAWKILRPSLDYRGEGGAIMVSVIEPASNFPPPPPLVAPPPPLPGQPPPPAPPRRLHYVPPEKGAIQATLQGVKGPPLDLYQSNGQIRMPTNAPPTSTPVPAYSAPGIQGSQIYSGKSPVPYKPTRFAKGFAPTNRSLGAKAAGKVGEVFDKAVEKTSVQKTIKVGGTRIHCAIAPLLLAAGCGGEPPAPPPKNDNDVRLSMPPPETLTGKKVKVPASASSVSPPSSGQH